ncbi:MAG: elongation factor Ts, partial [Ruthenibacterium sp.]
DMFRTFVKEVADVIMEQNPADVETLLTCKMPDGTTVEASRQDKVLIIGENIQIRRFVRYEGICAAYVHGGGTHGVLV